MFFITMASVFDKAVKVISAGWMQQTYSAQLRQAWFTYFKGSFYMLKFNLQHKAAPPLHLPIR